MRPLFWNVGSAAPDDSLCRIYISEGVISQRLLLAILMPLLFLLFMPLGLPTCFSCRCAQRLLALLLSFPRPEQQHCADLVHCFPLSS